MLKPRLPGLRLATGLDYNCVSRGGNNVVYVLGSRKILMIDVKSLSVTFN